MLGSLALGILSNLLTPSVRGLLLRGVLGRREAKIKQLKEILAVRAMLVQRPQVLYLYFIKEVFLFFSLAGGGSFIWIMLNRPGVRGKIFDAIFRSISLFLMGQAVGRSMANVHIIQTVRRFGKFEKKTLSKIKKLESKLKPNSDR